ncbi:MAG: septum formation initiator family protein [Bacillus sp. (in: Bacteria)]|nr:septum formation initiator family protein [Bacillus sp. (in: firmicutes)]
MTNNRKATIKRLNSDYIDEQSTLYEHKLKRKRGVIRRLSFYGIAMVIFLVFIGMTLHNQQQTIQEQAEKKQMLEEELYVMIDKELELKDEIELLHDPEYIAEIARRDFFLTMPGETLFQLPRSSNSTD